jgi:hypothetical protein
MSGSATVLAEYTFSRPSAEFCAWGLGLGPIGSSTVTLEGDAQPTSHINAPATAIAFIFFIRPSLSKIGFLRPLL